MYSVNGIFLKPKYKVYGETSIFYFNLPFSQPPGKNQQIRKQCCLPPLSFKISLRDAFFHISLNSLGFYFSRMLVEFYLTFVGKMFQFVVFTFLENALSLCIFLMSQSSTQNARQNFSKICCPKAKRVEETIICFIKIQSENMKMT